jgi:carbon-monoxide dehydrogenase small subunit
MFGVQADGCQIGTVEGLADGDRLNDLQEAFSRHHALQCGFCTPGFLMLAEAFLAEKPAPTEEEIREVVAANLCRCTGYQGIVQAISDVAKSRRERR